MSSQPGATSSASRSGRTTWPPPKTSEPLRKNASKRSTSGRPPRGRAAGSRGAGTGRGPSSPPRARNAMTLAGMPTGTGGARPKRRKRRAPAAMARTCAKALGIRSTIAAAPSASPRRGRSGVSVRAMPKTASATTATAASFSPVQERRAGLAFETRRPEREGEHQRGGGEGGSRRRRPARRAVPPAEADREPHLAGGRAGRNWQSATRSA